MTHRRQLEPLEAGKIRITLVRSTIGKPKNQEATVKALGLRRLHHSVDLPDNPSIRGMVTKVHHLVEVETAEA